MIVIYRTIEQQMLNIILLHWNDVPRWEFFALKYLQYFLSFPQFSSFKYNSAR